MWYLKNEKFVWKFWKVWELLRMNFYYKWQAYVQKQDGNKKSRINFDMETDEDESGEIFFCQDDHKYMKLCYLNLC